jgi:hypothetical protein
VFGIISKEKINFETLFFLFHGIKTNYTGNKIPLIPPLKSGHKSNLFPGIKTNYTGNKIPLIPPLKSGHKSNLFPWHKSILCWRCFQEFTVVPVIKCPQQVFHKFFRPLYKFFGTVQIPKKNFFLNLFCEFFGS